MRTEYAFPLDSDWGSENGMTLRDWFAGQALANPEICTGVCLSYEIDKWFGKDACGVTSEMIVSVQAYQYADAMLEARK